MMKHPNKQLDTWSMISLLTSWFQLGMGLGKVLARFHAIKVQVAAQPMLRQVVFLKKMLAYYNKQKRKVQDLEGLDDRAGWELTSISAAHTCTSSSQPVRM